MANKQGLQGLVGDGEGNDKLSGFWQGQLPATYRDSLSQKIHGAPPPLSFPQSALWRRCGAGVICPGPRVWLQ